MTDTLERRLRRQLEERSEDPSSLPESVQDLVAQIDEVFGNEGAGVPAAAVTAEASAPPELGLGDLPDIVFVLDDEGRILDCRGGDLKDLAFPRERLIGKRVTQCPFGDVGNQFAAALDATRHSRSPVSIEYALPCDNGLACFEARVVRHGERLRLAVVRNISRQAEIQTTIRQSAREYRDLLDAARAAILLLDPVTGTIIECNRQTATLYQTSCSALIGSALSDLFVDGTHLPDLQSIVQSGQPTDVETWHRVCDDRVVVVKMLLSRVIFEGRHAVLSVNREIHALEDELPEARNPLSMLKATFEATADGILVLDPAGHFVTSNRLFAEMWRLPVAVLQRGQEDEAMSIALAQLKQPAVLAQEMEAVKSSPRGRSSTIVELCDGRFFECVSMPQLIAGENAGRVWSFRDVTARVQSEERIRHHAFHDSLTGLPNRNLFQDRLAQELGRSRRESRSTALLLMDLDRFKTINDTLGHAAGDMLLVEVARRLLTRKREGDTIARLGGDEFVCLVSRLRHKEDAAVVAEQILEVLKPPIQIAEHDLHISASIGIALFPDDGDDSASLMKSADVALYRAKELGRNNYQIYEPKLSQRAMERLIMEKDLRQAIHNKEFILQYQPQFDLKTGAMCGVEALIRWMQDGAVVPPDKFISIAEECGLIVPLGRWVLEESARQCAEFNRISHDPLRLCVNISALQIQRPNFANEVSQILQATGVPLKQLVLELTESALMQNPEQGSWAMAQLEQMGVGLAMDDFGTGHSSLSNVSHLPISMIKIDRSFVKNCAKRKTDAAILTAIVTMGHALGLKVLAEGVETEEQAAVLRKQGCDEVQGYLYSRPVSADALIQQLRR